jgi:hypothetical protein
LWCWGDNGYGQLGIGMTGGGQLSPVQVGTDIGWVQVGVGNGHACAVRSDHSLWCWGSGENRDLDPNYPAQVAGGDVYASVAGSWTTDCAIRTDGTLWCWGEGISSSPAQVGTAGDWTQVSASKFDTCGVRADGSGWCWGGNLGNAR